MAGLQRSSISFRRQGSSGLVWDDRALSGDMDDQMMKQKEGTEPKELRTSRSMKAGRTRVDQLSIATKLDRNLSAGGGGNGRGRDFQRKRMVLPDLDPPSPKVSCCSFCSVSRKSDTDNLVVVPGKPKS